MMFGKSDKEMEDLMRNSKKALQSLMKLPPKNYFKKKVKKKK